MSTLTAADSETGTGGVLVKGSKEKVFSRVSIDTRTVRAGDVFFAIRGPNQDGHRFIAEALSKGAAGIVAERNYEHPDEFPADRVLIKVDDTHDALKKLARWMRNRWHGILVAVTGSMGKTTTREFACNIMRSKFSVYRTPGNYNNLFGLPLALFGLGSEYDLGIFEMGMSAPGEIEEMCRIATPSVGIITNVAPVHLQFFSSLEQIARAKGELAAALPPDGTLIYNADDPLVNNIAADFPGRKVSFGFSDSADVRADNVKILSLDETTFRISWRGISSDAKIALAGVHYVMNALAGAALGASFGITLPRIVQSIGMLENASMRGQVIRFAQGFVVIDDSYNSNPNALVQMIDVLSKVPLFKRRIVIAGEMLELGSSSGAFHYECGRIAAARGVDVLVGIQGASSEIVRGFDESGGSGAKGYFFPAAEDALDLIRSEVREGDLVLVKGSRGVRLEKVISDLGRQYEVLK